MDRNKEAKVCTEFQCRRLASVSVNTQGDKFLQYCLIHFYGSKYCQEQFKDQWIVLNKAVFDRQKSAADVILRRVMQEVKEEFEEAYSDSKRLSLTADVQSMSNGVSSVVEPKEKKRKKKQSHLWDFKPDPLKTRQGEPTSVISISVTGDEFQGLGADLTVPKNSNRKKVAALIKRALAVHSEDAVDNTALAKAALSIEEELCALHKFEKPLDEGNRVINVKKTSYMKHSRLIVNFLKDARNGHLRKQIISNTLTPQSLCSAKGMELLNPEMRQQRERSQQKLMKQRTKGDFAGEIGAQSDEYKCPSCGNSTANKFVPMQANSAHVSKSETWGNKDSLDRNRFRVVCSSCNHEFFK